MQSYDLRPVNAQRLRFDGTIIGEAHSPTTHVRIYRTSTGYVAEVALAQHDDELHDWETRAYISRDADRLARTLFQSRGGMEPDDPDLPLLRKAMDQAGIETGREV